MALKIKSALLLSSAILSVAGLPGYAQGVNNGNGPRSDGNAKMRWVDEVAPRQLTTETRSNMTSDTVDTVLSEPGFTTLPSLAATGGDNLGSHVASQDLDMANYLIMNVAAPVDIYDAANKSYVDATAEGAKDNLGNHIATQVLKMMNFEIVGLPLPMTPTSAANRAYVDTKVLDAKDNLGNHTAQTSLKMSNFQITGLGAPVNPADATTKAYVDQAMTAAKDNLGNHTATLNLDMATKAIVNLANPVNATDAANKGYVDGVLDGAVDTITVEIDALKARKINTTAGILGGGDLSQDRTLSFDTVWGDGRYALAARIMTAGVGLTGGGSLAGDRSFALTGQALALHNLAVNGLIARTGAGTVGARSIISTTNGGITVTNGNGVAGNPTLSVDDSVVATLAGTQTFSGGKNFTLSPTVPAPLALADAVNKGYVDTAIAGVKTDIGALYSRRIDTVDGIKGGGDLSANRTLSFDTVWGDARYALVSRTLTAGDGLAGGGDLTTNRTLSVDGTVVRTLGAQTIAGMKVFQNVTGTEFRQAAGQDGVALLGRAGGTGGFEVKVSPSVLTADRSVTLADGDTTLVAGIMVPTTRSVATGTGLTGGGDLSVNRTLAIDDTVVATLAGAQVFSGVKTFSASPKVPTPSALADAVNKGYVDTAISGAITAAAYTSGDGLTLTGRTFAVDGTVARTTRMIATSTGLTGGGDLSANRTLGIDSAVVATLAGTQTFAGAKTFTLAPTVPAPVLAGDATNKKYVDDTVAGSVAAAAYTAGDGMTLVGRSFAVDSSVVRTSGAQSISGLKTFGSPIQITGASTSLTGSEIALTAPVLTADRTVTFADGNTVLVAGTMVPTTRSVATGTGLSGGGDLSINRTLTIDNTVVATLAGAQTFAGAKTFTLPLVVPAPTLGAHAVNKDYLDTALANFTPPQTYSAGDGLTLTSGVFAADGTVLRSTGAYANPVWLTSLAGSKITGTVGIANGGTGAATAAGARAALDVPTTAGVGASGIWAIGISGNAASATKLATARTISLTGDVSGSVSFDGSENAPITATLANSGVTAGTYGSGTSFPSLTVDAKGRITAASNTAIAFPVTSVSGKTGAVALVSADITDATAANTANMIVKRDASGGFSAGTITGALNGNAATATRLAADRTINGVIFNGTANINVPDLRDANGKVLIDGTGVTSAVNYVTLTNAATAGTVKLLTEGTDLNIPLEISTKGTGTLTFGNGSGNVSIRPGVNAFLLYDDTNDHYVNVNVPELAAHRTLTLSADGNTVLTTGTMLATDDLLAASSTATGAVKYNGATAADGVFHGGAAVPVSTAVTRLNYSGVLYANQFYATAYYYFSDQRLKKDIVALDGMGKINDLRPVSYAWKADGRKALGLIAQEVEQVYPTAVTTNENGIKAVDYIQLIAPMLAAIQDLDARVKELEAR